MKFGLKIKEARKNKKWSVYDLAAAIGVKSPGYISRIEGRGEIPGSDMIVKISEALNIDTEELLILAGQEKGKEAKRVAEKKYEKALILYRKNKKK